MSWSKAIYDRFRAAGIGHYVYIPDAGNADLVRLAQADSAVTTHLLTSEEQGVALCAGLDLVGARGVVLMQSSGVGNCVNFLSLVKAARFPILMVVTMRGEYGETNPWQYPMGQATVEVLRAMGVLPFIVRHDFELTKTSDAALAASLKGGISAALVLSQSFLGAKSI